MISRILSIVLHTTNKKHHFILSFLLLSSLASFFVFVLMLKFSFFTGVVVIDVVIKTSTCQKRYLFLFLLFIHFNQLCPLEKYFSLFVRPKVICLLFLLLIIINDIVEFTNTSLNLSRLTLYP